MFNDWLFQINTSRSLITSLFLKTDPGKFGYLCTSLLTLNILWKSLLISSRSSVTITEFRMSPGRCGRQCSLAQRSHDGPTRLLSQGPWPYMERALWYPGHLQWDGEWGQGPSFGWHFSSGQGCHPQGQLLPAYQTTDVAVGQPSKVLGPYQDTFEA